MTALKVRGCHKAWKRKWRRVRKLQVLEWTNLCIAGRFAPQSLSLDASRLVLEYGAPQEAWNLEEHLVHSRTTAIIIHKKTGIVFQDRRVTADRLVYVHKMQTTATKRNACTKKMRQCFYLHGYIIHYTIAHTWIDHPTPFIFWNLHIYTTLLLETQHTKLPRSIVFLCAWCLILATIMSDLLAQKARLSELRGPMSDRRASQALFSWKISVD